MIQDYIKTIIVDDEISFINTLEILLQRHPQFQIIGKARSTIEAIQLIKNKKPQLIFLDVQLGDGSGFDVLNAVGRDNNAEVVFVTAYDEYAVKAFRFSAVDYLLKPIIYEDLVAALERVEYSIKSKLSMDRFQILLSNLTSDQSKKKIVLREADTHHIVNLDDIMWCMAEGSYTSFYLTDQRTIIVSKNLKEYEEILGSNGFFRIHRSYVVNLNKVLKLEKAEGGVLYLQGNHQLPVSTRKREKLSMRLNKL